MRLGYTAPMTPAKPFQFGLRSLFVLTALVAAMIGTARVDLGLALLMTIIGIWSVCIEIWWAAGRQ